jgi:transposase
VNHYAGIDVSLELSSVCIVDATGELVKEAKVESHPDALVKFFKALGLPLTVIGLEAGPLSQWIYAGLTKAGFVTSLMETRHVKSALSAMTVKTDRRDARGIAQLLRMGWFRPVHAKSAGSQEVRALLVARKQLQHKFGRARRCVWIPKHRDALHVGGDLLKQLQPLSADAVWCGLSR